MNNSVEFKPRYKMVPEEYLIDEYTEDEGWKPVVIEANSEMIEVSRDSSYYSLVLCERKR